MPSKKKLKGKARMLASKFIAEEIQTRKYPRSQAIAIGISRAKAKAKKESFQSRLETIIKKYL
jgi:hypothetical protein